MMATSKTALVQLVTIIVSLGTYVAQTSAIPIAQTSNAALAQSFTLHPHESNSRSSFSYPVVSKNTLTARQVPSSSTSSKSEVLVYYGQVLPSPGTDLTDICADPNIDKVALAFLTSFTDAAGFPVLSIGKNCLTASNAQIAAGASGLYDCVSSGLAKKVAACQAAGKPVLLSLGGGAATSMAIPSQGAAQQYAQAIWDLFFDSSRVASLRPFGDVVLDGIDIDIEHGSGDYLIDFVSSLRKLMDTSTIATGKQYLITAAPQCSDLITATSNVPATTIPWLEIAPYLDSIMVQFYNNPTCDFSQTELFMSSLTAWSRALSNVTRINTMSSGGLPSSSRNSSTLASSRPSYNIVSVDGTSARAAPAPPRVSSVSALSTSTVNNKNQPGLLIGVTATSEVGSGYIPANSLAELLQEVKTKALPNLVGVMFWDGVWCMTSASSSVAANTRSFHEIGKTALSNINSQS